MKKILFALVGVMTMAVSSCLPETGYSYSSTYSRVTTIDTTTATVSFKADYTGEIFNKITNLMYPEELAAFDLEGAKRAEILVRLDVEDSYKASLFMLDARKIDILPITSTMPTDPLMPLAGLQLYPLGGTTLTPAVWVSDGYLNVLPIIPSNKAGKYFLMPDSVKSDTLHFSLKASYQAVASKKYYEDILCYDLRTLRDTAKADSELRTKMVEMLEALKEHRADSVRIAVTGLYDIHYYEKDTIMEQREITNYFKYNF